MKMVLLEESKPGITEIAFLKQNRHGTIFVGIIEQEDQFIQMIKGFLKAEVEKPRITKIRQFKPEDMEHADTYFPLLSCQQN